MLALATINTEAFDEGHLKSLGLMICNLQNLENFKNSWRLNENEAIHDHELKLSRFLEIWDLDIKAYLNIMAPSVGLISKFQILSPLKDYVSQWISTK